MFIDEQTRMLQKHILEALNTCTGSNGGELHREEVERYLNNPNASELSNFVYCRELTLKSWYQNLDQPGEEQKRILWEELVSRCGMVDVDAPLDWGRATDISTLLDYLKLKMISS